MAHTHTDGHTKRMAERKTVFYNAKNWIVIQNKVHKGIE